MARQLPGRLARAGGLGGRLSPGEARAPPLARPIGRRSLHAGSTRRRRRFFWVTQEGPTLLGGWWPRAGKEVAQRRWESRLPFTPADGLSSPSAFSSEAWRRELCIPECSSLWPHVLHAGLGQVGDSVGPSVGCLEWEFPVTRVAARWVSSISACSLSSETEGPPVFTERGQSGTVFCLFFRCKSSGKCLRPSWGPRAWNEAAGVGWGGWRRAPLGIGITKVSKGTRAREKWFFEAQHWRRCPSWECLGGQWQR